MGNFLLPDIRRHRAATHMFASIVMWGKAYSQERNVKIWVGPYQVSVVCFCAYGLLH